MSEIRDDFKSFKEYKKLKKIENLKLSEINLINYNLKIKKFSDYHWLVGERVDFWASTGKWIDRATKSKGRGVFNLIEYVKNCTITENRGIK